MDTSVDEANRMLDAFESVGVSRFHVTKTDIGQDWTKDWSSEIGRLREKLPTILSIAATRQPYDMGKGKMIMAGENVIIRPLSDTVAFVQLDDLKPDQLQRLKAAAFLIHATSPGSSQAWIAVSDIDPSDKEAHKAFMRRVRKAVGGVDKTASGATRLAGTENFKFIYQPEFPRVRIIEVHPGRVMTVQQLAGMGLVAAAEAPLSPSPESIMHKIGRRRTPKKWPNYERALEGAPAATHHEGPDRSMADFFWCFLAAREGWSIEEIAAKLTDVSPKAHRMGKAYAMDKARAAAAEAERPRSPQRGF